MNINEKLTKEFIVDISHSAKNIGSGDLDVLSTPMLVAYIEETCKDLLNKYLEKDLGSVGSNININHLAPSKISSTIIVEATIKEIKKEKIITFFALAYEKINDDKKKIADCSHTRVIINNKKFLEKL
ncbi:MULTISPECIES: thioesterase family protein [unclassified Gemella]|uniref:thioesterase family protein n=1 Tax=unclassified Gemella TaxID=2624949 RepID=UPI001C03D8E4|nr:MULTISPECIES: hotdog domain-containing protein [unclassified Gemella]MBU0278037.1 dihydrolipoamide acyltransferase [Gemella sp. zg-1178]QWQ38433.1 dihydrolipoamide acyltransferase [Gemella sp. zg-570]